MKRYKVFSKVFMTMKGPYGHKNGHVGVFANEGDHVRAIYHGRYGKGTFSHYRLRTL